MLSTVQAPADKRPIALSIGEPKHRSPAFVAAALSANLDQPAVYPTTCIPVLREARQPVGWRFGLPSGVDPARHVLPVTAPARSAMFAFTQAVVVWRDVDGFSQSQPVSSDL
jgi:N-succinyldiaminopimelate aminotransferase